jgi:hypothetical protein
MWVHKKRGVLIIQSFMRGVLLLLWMCVFVLQALRAIADKLEGPQGAGMLTAAVHASAIEFLMNRLPPHPKQLAGKGRAPTLDDKVWCRVAGWGYLLPFEMTGMVCEDDDSNGEHRRAAWQDATLISTGACTGGVLRRKLTLHPLEPADH